MTGLVKYFKNLIKYNLGRSTWFHIQLNSKYNIIVYKM